VDPERLTLACATALEQEAGERAGLATSLVGLRGVNGLPQGRLVSFGLAGALREDLPCGTVLDGVRVVDPDGRVLWQGEPLGIPDAVLATILAAPEVVDDPAERRRLAEATGADAVDLESGPIAETGRLAGCLRVVSDTPARGLSGICSAVKPEGPVSWTGLAVGFARSPFGFTRAAADGKRALRVLHRAAEALA